MKPNMQEVRTKLAALREQNHLTSRQMAGLIGVKRNAYAQWEYGYTQPGPKNARLLVDFWEEPLATLLAPAAIVRKGSRQEEIIIL